MQLIRIALSIFLCPLLILAQPAPQDVILRWMDNIAQQHLAARADAIARIRTTADAERRQQWVRSKLLEIIGGLPDSRGPLNARVTGRLKE